MKKIFNISALLVALTTVFSCNKVEQVAPEKEISDVFEYVFALGNSQATKALISSDDNGLFALWESGDQLGSITTESSGVTSGFSNITPANGDTPAIFKIYSKNGLAVGDKIYVWYPIAWSGEDDPTAVWFEIPAAQSVTSDGFDFDAMPMVTKEITVDESIVSSTNTTDVTTIDLANLGSLLNFKVFSTNAAYQSEKVVSITFTADNANIAGAFEKNLTTVDPDDEDTMGIGSFMAEDTSSSVPAPSNEITTTLATAAAIGTSSTNALDVYMVIAPGSYTGTVTVTTDVTSYTYTISTAKTFARSGLKAFGLDLKKGTRAKLTQNVEFSPSSVSANLPNVFTAPTLSGVLSTGAKTWSSSNTSVATIDENTGVVTLVATGTTTISVTVAEDETYRETSASYTLTVNKASQTFEKYTSTTFVAGKYIIVNSANEYVATGQLTSGNKLSADTVSLDSEEHISCTSDYILEFEEVESGIFSIKNSDGKYISWASSTDFAISDANTSNTAKWTISINSQSKQASIQNVSANTRYIKFATSDFRAYTSTNGTGVFLYSLLVSKELASITLSGTYQTSFYVGDTFSYDGLVVTAHYDNGTDNTVSPSTVTGYDMTSVGSQTITVSYTEKGITKTATYTITVSAKPVYTVTYSDGGYSTEAEGGAGVVLPTREDDGDWLFQGWSETNIASATTTMPTILTGTYHPVDNIILYPVYKKSIEVPGTPTWTVTRSLAIGKTYVFGAVKAAANASLANNTTFGAVAFAQTYNSSSDTWADYKDITPNSSGVVSNSDVTNACKWYLEDITEGNYKFKKGDSYLYLADTAGSTSGAQCGLNTTGACYIEDVNSTCKDAFLLHPTSSSKKVMLYNVSSKGYRMYAPRTYNASMSPYIRFYVETSTVETVDSYISVPE